MKYVALLRGIGPENPNMHHEPFRKFFESLGFTNVQPVISSGNVVFETDEIDGKALEDKIEKALPEKLGFSSTTIIRNQNDLQELSARNPFKDLPDEKNLVWNVTFLKSGRRRTETDIKFPYQGEGFELLENTGREVPNVIDISQTPTPKVMSFLEKNFSKQITMRTWKTVQRILNKMES